jgi:hypothetical protein
MQRTIIETFCGSLLVASLIWAQPATQEAGPAYSVVFHRPQKVGEKHRLRVVGSVEYELTLTATKPETSPFGKSFTTKESFALTLVAVQEVLEVNAAGSPLRLRMVVEQFDRERRGEHEELLPRGSAFTARFEDGQTLFEGEGIRLLQKVEESLAALLDFTLGEDIDRAYGSREPRRPGDSWPINADATAELFRRARERFQKGGLRMSWKDLAGKITLVEATSSNGAQALRVHGDVEAKISAPSEPVGPNDTELQNGHFHMSFEALLPVDRNLKPSQGTLTLELESTGWTAQKSVELSLLRRSTNSGTLTPVP